MAAKLAVLTVSCTSMYATLRDIETLMRRSTGLRILDLLKEWKRDTGRRVEATYRSYWSAVFRVGTACYIGFAVVIYLWCLSAMQRSSGLGLDCPEGVSKSLDGRYLSSRGGKTCHFDPALMILSTWLLRITNQRCSDRHFLVYWMSSGFERVLMWVLKYWIGLKTS